MYLVGYSAAVVESYVPGNISDLVFDMEMIDGLRVST
jgi:hypothetical protein